MPARILEEAVESHTLALGVLPPFELESFREGHLSPCFLRQRHQEAGVAELLAGLGVSGRAPCRAAPMAASSSRRDQRLRFVFKVQANMDPKPPRPRRHRAAVLGVFKRGMKLFNAREKRHMAIANPIFFFAQERETVDEAVAGDIIGIPNHGMLRVGDTLSEGEKPSASRAFPTSPPKSCAGCMLAETR